MSVVLRAMQGRDYLQVRRKVFGVQKQHFINVTDCSPKELALAKNRANKLDNELKEQQGEFSLSSLFVCNAALANIRVVAPCSKSGWTVKCIIQKTKNQPLFTRARSIDRWGFDKAFEIVFDDMAAYLGFSETSFTAQVFRAVSRSHLKAVYAQKLAEYKRS